MGLYISGVLIVTYLGFVFFSEQLNPIKKPSYYIYRRRWRYGRKMGFSAGVSALVAVLLYGLMKFDPVIALLVAASQFLMLWWFFSAQHKRAEAAG